MIDSPIISLRPDKNERSSYAPAVKKFGHFSCLRSPGADTISFIQPLDTLRGVVAPTPLLKSVVPLTTQALARAADSDFTHPTILTGVSRMFGLGMAEILVVCVIGLLLFGNKLPGLARSLGRSFVEFRKELSGIEEDIR
jgi:TatA/E family protein of Tat protein translocase